jgi:hypothetical protein
VTDGGGMRQIEGTSPEALLRELAEVGSIRELADSAMLLSQGAHRAIEMKHEANNTSLEVPATAASPQD